MIVRCGYLDEIVAARSRLLAGAGRFVQHRVALPDRRGPLSKQPLGVARRVVVGWKFEYAIFGQ